MNRTHPPPDSVAVADAAAEGDGDFDEVGYLRAYPDVAAAVAVGRFSSGLQHYHMHGASEGRCASRVVSVASSVDQRFPALKAVVTDMLAEAGLSDPTELFRRLLPVSMASSFRIKAIAALPHAGHELDTACYDFILEFTQRVADDATFRADRLSDQDIADWLQAIVRPASTGAPPDAAELYGLGSTLVAAGVGEPADTLADLLLEAACLAAPSWPVPWQRWICLLASRTRSGWRRDLFGACAHLRALEPQRSETAIAFLGLLMLELEQSDAAVAMFEELRAQGPDDPIAAFGVALAHERKLAAIPLAHRGRDGAADRESVSRALDTLGEPHRSHVAALLLRARFAQLCGDFEAAGALARRVVEAEPHSRAARWLAATSAQYLGDLRDAEARLMELARDGCDLPLTKHIGHLRHWSGRTSRFVGYVDSEPTAGGVDLPDARELAEHRLLFLAVLSDHDFALSMTISPPSPGTAVVLARSTTPAAFQLERASDGGVTLRLGDGSEWGIAALRCPGPSDPTATLTVVVERHGGRISLSTLGGGRALAMLPWGYAVPGDTLVVGDDPRPTVPLPFMPLGLLVEIARYRPAASPPAAIHLYSAFYGQHFLEMLSGTMFPSLMVSGNLPDLAADYSIVHAIYCTHRETLGLDGHRRTLADLGYGCRLDDALLGAFGHDPRQHLADTLVDAIEWAVRDNALLVFAPPDHVFGASLDRIVRAMKPFDYVVAGHPRVTYEDAYPRLRELFAQPDVRRQGIPNDVLVRMAMEEFPHSITETGLQRPEPFWNATRQDDRYLVRFREPPPLVVHPTRDLVNVIRGDTYAPSFETIDHDLVDFVGHCGRLSMVQDSREFFWIEYCSRQRNHPTVWNDYWSATARTCASTDLHWHRSAEDPGQS